MKFRLLALCGNSSAEIHFINKKWQPFWLPFFGTFAVKLQNSAESTLELPEQDNSEAGIPEYKERCQ